MSLLDRQRSYRGLVFGGPGTSFILDEEDGLQATNVRSSDVELAQDDGAIPGRDLTASRTVSWKFNVTGTPDEVESRMEQLTRAFATSRLEEHRLTFKDPGMPERFVRARVSRWSAPRSNKTEGFGQSSRTVKVDFRCPDPRIYSVESFSTLVQPSAVFELPGLDLPFDLDADFPQNPGPLGGGLLAQANNEGTSDAFPLLQFQVSQGTVHQLDLHNITTDQHFLAGESINGTQLSVATGQTLVADMSVAKTRRGGHVPVRIAEASRQAFWLLPREPFALVPGFQTVRLSVSGVNDPIVVCRLTWRSTDL